MDIETVKKDNKEAIMVDSFCATQFTLEKAYALYDPNETK